MNPIRDRFLSGLVAAAVLLAGGCSRPEPPAQAAAPTPATATPVAPVGAKALAFRPNVLLVTLDTTRADHLGCYGDRKAATPRLDRIAAEGVLVEQAIATAPLTFPSHCSILTGLYPPKHGVRDNADFRLPDSVKTLAEQLREGGYSTHAVVASYILASSLGLTQGFDTYDEPRAPARTAASGMAPPPLERPANEITDAGIRALDAAQGKPFFLWVHYYDPHVPYRPPESYAKKFADRPYDGEIAFTDAEIGRLLDDLAKRGALDRTLVVVTGDHGEGLGEHGESTHGIFVYDSSIHVPMLLRLPGAIPAGKRAKGVVSTVDVVPTVLELLGEPPLPGVEGASFAATARGGDDTRKDPVYAESLYPERIFGWAPLYALRDGSTKFIEAPEAEIYDVAADPGERKNLAPSRGKDAAAWRSRLEALTQSFGPANKAAESPMDAEALQKLQSLGYVSGGSSRTNRTTRPDPKEMIEVNEKFVKAQALADEKPAEALALLGQALAKDPENAAAMGLSGTLSFWKTGERERGLKQLASAAHLSPGVFEIQWNLANALYIAGRGKESADAYRAALAIQPASAEARYRLGKALYLAGDAPGALKEVNAAMQMGFRNPEVLATRGIALAATGDRAGAERDLREAVAADPKIAEAWNKLGILAAQGGKNEEARDLFGRALTADPDNADALYNHAQASMMLKDRAPAERDVARLLEKHPEYPKTWYLKAHLLIASGDREGARTVVKTFLARAKDADPQQMASAQDLLKKLGG